MAGKDGTKRKRQSNEVEAPSKKVAFDDGNTIKVSHVNESGPQPVLVAAPGIVPPRISFAAYTKPNASKYAKDSPKPWTHDLLLQSSQHPRLDYTAAPNHLESSNTTHYIAVFDPATNSLHIQPSHNLSLRVSPRQPEADANASPARTFAQQREALGREFGTKKAKKVIESRTVNAIGQDTKGKGKKDDVQDAVLDSMADAAESAPKKEQVDADLLASKPIPKPNLAADDIEEVYPFNTLIPPHEARLVTVKDWQDATRAEKELKFFHRYPATHVRHWGKSEDVQRLKALKYLALLLEFHDALQSAGKPGKKVPKKEFLTKKLGHWPEALVDSVRRRFSNPANELPKWHLDNLYTHMCALALFIEGFATNTSQLKEDLKMENRQIGQYYQELGCKVGAPLEKEREKWGLNKAQAAATRVARLKLPLEFPKARVGRKR
ncbi:RNA polymerase I associated factor, A49-like protein [Teratosphaeria nubilosa]|uniref:RNA polymerase I associated factor, A49-like protein n=1 Tax=Teratosphaeria nubilosa TaxID=161662 RepID=A0A6G1LKW1_9PEZI|nr:RNA polymerase I associated factor, A49-like protein [Teratosphaeria nubilosa]